MQASDWLRCVQYLLISLSCWVHSQYLLLSTTFSIQYQAWSHSHSTDVRTLATPFWPMSVLRHLLACQSGIHDLLSEILKFHPGWESSLRPLECNAHSLPMCHKPCLTISELELCVIIFWSPTRNDTWCHIGQNSLNGNYTLVNPLFVH